VNSTSPDLHQLSEAVYERFGYDVYHEETLVVSLMLPNGFFWQGDVGVFVDAMGGKYYCWQTALGEKILRHPDDDFRPAREIIGEYFMRESG
jgi:hypothetical protein